MASETCDTIHGRIKFLRKSLGLTQTEFGKSIGVSRDAVAAYERVVVISEAVMKLICSLYNVSEIWLREGIEPMFHEMSREEEIAAYMGDLLASDDEEKEIQKRFIKMLSKLDVNDWKTIDKMVTLMAKEKD